MVTVTDSRPKSGLGPVSDLGNVIVSICVPVARPGRNVARCHLCVQSESEPHSETSNSSHYTMHCLSTPLTPSANGADWANPCLPANLRASFDPGSLFRLKNELKAQVCATPFAEASLNLSCAVSPPRCSAAFVA